MTSNWAADLGTVPLFTEKQSYPLNRRMKRALRWNFFVLLPIFLVFYFIVNHRGLSVTEAAGVSVWGPMVIGVVTLGIVGVWFGTADARNAYRTKFTITPFALERTNSHGRGADFRLPLAALGGIAAERYIVSGSGEMSELTATSDVREHFQANDGMPYATIHLRVRAGVTLPEGVVELDGAGGLAFKYVANYQQVLAAAERAGVPRFQLENLADAAAATQSSDNSFQPASHPGRVNEEPANFSATQQQQAQQRKNADRHALDPRSLAPNMMPVEERRRIQALNPSFTPVLADGRWHYCKAGPNAKGACQVNAGRFEWSWFTHVGFYGFFALQMMVFSVVFIVDPIEGYYYTYLYPLALGLLSALIAVIGILVRRRCKERAVPKMFFGYYK